MNTKKPKKNRITYDKQADAVYIYLRDAKFAKNKVLSEFVIVDLDAKNIPIGVEILDASKILTGDRTIGTHKGNMLFA